MLENNFYNNEKELIEFYLNTELFPKYKKNSNLMNLNKNSLELIIRPECNQKCEYCYITQHGDELFPKRLNKEETLHNIDLILDYVYNTQKSYFNEIQLFAGDLFYDNIFFDIMDIFKKYLKKIKKSDPRIFDIQTLIVIPSNLSFVYYQPEKAKKFLEYQKYFRDTFNTRLMFSWSTDGIYAAKNVREKKELSEDYFNTIMKFVILTDSGIHPMISAEGIDFQFDNYVWFIKKIKEFSGEKIREFQPMFLEVRNNNWTQEKIDKYLNFLSKALEYRLQLCDNSKEKLAYHLFKGDGENNTLKRSSNNYDFLLIPEYVKHPTFANRNEGMGCGLQTSLMINCTNLSLVPCHRLTYSQFTGCYFKTNKKNNKIIDIIPHNISGFINIHTHKLHNQPICHSCEINSICFHGCLGSQFEHSGEIMLPIPQVCNLFKQKFNHLIKIYNEYGLIQEAIDKKYLDYNKERKEWILKKTQEMGYIINE